MTHRILAVLIALTCTAALLVAQESAPDHRAAIGAALDDFHDAAATGAFDRYFGHWHDEGIFLGTDVTERWTVAEFKAFAEPYFADGEGWVYTPRSREVVIDEARGVAWFDEVLDSRNYGTSRGSGTLLLEDGRWLVAQYHLTFPVPNDIAEEITDRIKAWEAEQ